MKEKRISNDRKWSFTITLIVIFTTIGLLLLLADIFIDLVYTPLQDISRITINCVATIAGFWITCYLLFLELFKDRYPMEMLKEKHLPRMRNHFALLLCVLIYGCVVALFDYPLLGCSWYVLSSAIATILVFVEVYHANKTLMVNTYIDNFFEKISEDFDESEFTISKKALQQIHFIFEESLIKEEYYTSRNIAQKTGKTFRRFLKHSLELSVTVGPDEAENAFDQIVAFNMSQLELCKNIKSELVLDTLVREQKENISFCIDHRQFDWYKKYIHQYNLFVFQMHKENNSIFAEELYPVYAQLAKKLIKSNQKEAIDYFVEELEALTFTYIYAYNKVEARNYIQLLTNLLEMCLDENSEEHYKLKKFVEMKTLSSGTFNDVKVFYSYLFSVLTKRDIEKAFNFASVIIDCRAKGPDDSSLIEFKLYCIQALYDKFKDNASKQTELFSRHVSVLREAIELRREYDGSLILPDFYDRIKAQGCPQETIDETLSALKKLLNYCIIKDYVPIYFSLLEEVKDALSQTTQQQKELQKDYLGIYYWLLTKTTTIANQQFFEVTFDSFSLALEEMDKNTAISNKLGKSIIFNIAQCAQRSKEEDRKLVLHCVDLLHSFLDEEKPLRFVALHPETKRFLFRCLFNIGTTCIENNFEEGLRRVSNTIGWLIIHCIKQTTQDLAIYLIERANELLYIAEKMEVSQKTQMFLLTLFTTVGSYCCKEPNYKKYLDAVINGIKHESLEHIQVAVSLRTSENDMWNELFENETPRLTKAFLKRFKEAIR